MSYPYPQDRHADRKTKGEQPYKDEKESLTQQASQIQAEAEAYGEARRDESDEDRSQRVADEMRERLRQVAEEVRQDENA
ncbi:MAG: hypothetical protein M3Q71_23130 [Chloroflexota bacterium]|nr:hypothetical protein [Chloroflexota bacterium]MDP9473518.1 hypothetical protein [Chloroflexota bacterium]